MKIQVSKEFEKSARRLSGKHLQSLRNMIQEVCDASSIQDLTDCKKLSGLENIYRIRVGDYRAFFSHIEVTDECVRFLYLCSRGQAYDKKMIERFKSADV